MSLFVVDDASHLPLFGVQSKARGRLVGDGVEVVMLGRDGFEKDQSSFWFVFEWTLGWLLARHIEQKSRAIVLGRLSQPGDFVKRNGNNGGIDRGQILTKARQDFGSKRIAELFEIRTRGFNNSSPLMQHFCRFVAQAEALDDVYNARGSFAWNGGRIFPESAEPDRYSNFYLNCPNAQGVRNRYRQVARLYEQMGGGRTLSIACGSAQPLIHAINALRAGGRDQGVELLLIDISQESLDIARRRAEQAGVDDIVRCEKMSFFKLPQRFDGEKFDIIEACGILDYLSDEHVIAMLGFALNSLESGGKIIVSNMSETRGADILRRTYNWAIRYRSPRQLGQLVKKAGGKNIKVFVEPWGIHPVATASS